MFVDELVLLNDCLYASTSLFYGDDDARILIILFFVDVNHIVIGTARNTLISFSWKRNNNSFGIVEQTVTMVLFYPSSIHTRECVFEVLLDNMHICIYMYMAFYTICGYKYVKNDDQFVFFYYI